MLSSNGLDGEVRLENAYKERHVRREMYKARYRARFCEDWCMRDLILVGKLDGIVFEKNAV